jgi:hypothetical protein
LRFSSIGSFPSREEFITVRLQESFFLEVSTGISRGRQSDGWALTVIFYSRSFLFLDSAHVVPYRGIQPGFPFHGFGSFDGHPAAPVEGRERGDLRREQAGKIVGGPESILQDDG